MKAVEGDQLDNKTNLKKMREDIEVIKDAVVGTTETPGLVHKQRDTDKDVENLEKDFDKLKTTVQGNGVPDGSHAFRIEHLERWRQRWERVVNVAVASVVVSVVGALTVAVARIIIEKGG